MQSIGASPRLVAMMVALAVALAVASTAAADSEGRSPSESRKVAPAPRRTPDLTRAPDIHFEPTPQSAVDKMLAMAGIKKTDVVYDLGCGDGRIVVTAAKRYGVRAIGVDIDPERVKESRANVRKNRVGRLVTIKHADIFEFDFSNADVVTLYLLPDLNVRLMPKLSQLKPGARIISYEFGMSGAVPAEVFEGRDANDDPYTIYKWVVPWKKQ